MWRRCEGGGRQELIDRHVTLMLERAIRSPGASVQRVVETLLRAGPLVGKQAIIELFKGREGLPTTTWGLGPARGAVREGELGSLPATTRLREARPIGYTIPETGRNIRRWAPRVGPGGGLLFAGADIGTLGVHGVEMHSDWARTVGYARDCIRRLLGS